MKKTKRVRTAKSRKAREAFSGRPGGPTRKRLKRIAGDVIEAGTPGQARARSPGRTRGEGAQARYEVVNRFADGPPNEQGVDRHLGLDL